MNITNIRIYPADGSTSRKASVGFVVDNKIAFHGLNLIEGNDGKLFLSLPARKNAATGLYEEVFFSTVSMDAKDDLTKKVLAAWEEVQADPTKNSIDLGDPDADMKLDGIHITKGKNGKPDHASVVLDDDLVLSGLRIVPDRETGAPRVFMPSRKMKDGTFKDVCHPITSESRKTLIDAVLEAYKAFSAK